MHLRGLMRATLIAVLLTALAGHAFAEGWTPTLGSHKWTPRRMIAIDKGEQAVFLLEHESPLKAIRKLPCTTGQVEGDKEVRGDLRTPEGVYFLGSRIRRSLGWELYGNLAYALNYPNPVDRINGKTGSGIWLHGRGKTLTPRDTRGCIAMKVPDLQSLGSGLEPGTPVVVARDVSWTPDPGGEGKTANELVKRVHEWAADWQNRSEKFFDYFDPVAFTLSGSGDFARYRAHKENIFAHTPWIHVMVDDVHAVAGPDYWVTWFDQYYRSPSLSQTVGKRFYWKKNEQGHWVIVGREYAPASRDLQPEYVESVRRDVDGLLEGWVAAWKNSDVDSYMKYYSESPVQGNRRGFETIRDYKKTLWAEKPPVSISVDDVKISLIPRGLRVAFVQKYEDASGYSDRGVKTLVLAPKGDVWEIEREEWRRL